MRQLQPVIWTKGTFLSPQHLQAQERFVEDSSRFYLDALKPKSWGFLDLQIDSKAVAEGTLAVSRASGIFPDALALDLPLSDAPPPARNLDECFQTKRESCLFFLAIPQYTQGGMNISLADGRVSTRYLAQLQMLRDENSGAGEKPVQLARKNLRLLAEGENLEDSVLLPCARVVRSEAGIFQLDETWLPPLLDLHAHPLLKRLLSGLIEQLVGRSSQLAGTRREKNRAAADFTAADVTNFWLLYTINTHLPALRHLLETARVHPALLFQEMSALAGALTTFCDKVELRDLPAYNHEQLGEVFASLDRKVRFLLDCVIPRNFVSLPLRLVRDTVYAASIDQDSYFEGSRFYLAVAADLRDPDLIDRVLKLLKLCSASDIEQVVRMALPGLRLQHVGTPPRAIPVKLRYQYFAIEQAGKYWDGVRRGRNLAVYVPSEILNPQMELIVLLNQPA